MAEDRSKSSWLANMSVQGKFACLIAIMLALFLVLLTANTITTLASNQIQDRADRLAGLIDQSNLTARAISRRQISLVRGLFSPSPAAVETFEASTRDVSASIAKVGDLVDDDALLHVALDRARTMNDAWLRTVAAPAFALVKGLAAHTANPGDRDGVLENLLAAEVSEGGSRSIVAALDQMTATASRQLRTARDELATGDMVVNVIDVTALVLALAAAAAALYLSSRLISMPLRHLAELMERVADHDHDVVVPQLGRRDEVGIIARALNVFKAMAIETHENDWIKTGVGAISTRLQQAEDFRPFADALLSELAPLVNAGVAVFYRFDEASGTLDLLGSYGYTARKHVSTSYKLGEGLVGQSALEQKPIVLSPVPDDYIRIHSGTGEAAPRSIMVMPIVASGRLLGVLELASFEPMDGPRQRLIADAAPMVALSFDNMSRAIRTRLLLEQTQRQATELRVAEEELRTQQEELRATNEQLQQQSQRLVASEEELRVQAEELQHSNEVLRGNAQALNAQNDRLEELHKETEAKAEDLARANQYKSQFLANMSHELRTPLNSLLILSHDLAENRAGNLDADQVESASIIHDSGSNLLRLINEILDLSKVEAGKMDVVREPVDVGDFATRLERGFRRMAEDKGLAFRVTTTPDAPAHIVSDSGKLEQITNNLVGNALKFTGEGTVSVVFSGVTVPGAAGPGPALAVAVTDTGIGIPTDKLGTVFEAFEQVDASTRRQFGGTGLGLAISRSLAVLLGGDVTVESELGVGSTFRLVVPVGSEATPAVEAAAPSSAPAPRPSPRPAYVIEDDRNALVPGATVFLVVEDDPAFARTLVGLIRRKGHLALAAMDGESGLALARAHKPTGILLDVMLPGMDGWAVIAQLKADAATRHIPVHFVSALEETVRGRDLGAVGFLTKPVSAEDLTGALSRLLHFAADRARRVLVVDDDHAARHAVQTLIGRPGIEIGEAGSGEEALGLLAVQEFDCIILDLGLPGMSGFEFLEKLAAGEQEVPVVVYSGRDLTREESLQLRAYTDSIVVKGAMSPERLLDEVSLFLHSVQHGTRTVPAEPDGDLAGRRLLLVDDDMRNIYALAKVLRGKGIEVILAQDGAKAIAQLGERPDTEIVLMDIMMPVMDGYEAMTEIRKIPRLAKLPIIALTAKAMAGDREKCLAAGASDYLSKPIDVPKLLSLLRVWLPSR